MISNMGSKKVVHLSRSLGCCLKFLTVIVTIMLKSPFYRLEYKFIKGRLENFHSYVVNRVQRVKVNGCSSSIFPKMNNSATWKR